MVLDTFTIVTSAAGNGTVVTSGIGVVTEGIDMVASTGVIGTARVHVVVAVVAGTRISEKIGVVDDPGGSGSGIELVEPLLRTRAWP